MAVDIGKALEYGKQTHQAVRKYVRDYHKQSLVIPAIYPRKKILLVHPNGVDNLCAYRNSEKQTNFNVGFGMVQLEDALQTGITWVIVMSLLTAHIQCQVKRTSQQKTKTCWKEIDVPISSIQ